MADASTMQVATLVASLVSALGSMTVALTNYRKVRHETRPPRLRVAWNEKGVIVRIRNNSVERTAHSLGFTCSYLLFLRVDEFDHIANFGPEMPTAIPAWQRAQW